MLPRCPCSCPIAGGRRRFSCPWPSSKRTGRSGSGVRRRSTPGWLWPTVGGLPTWFCPPTSRGRPCCGCLPWGSRTSSRGTCARRVWRTRGRPGTRPRTRKRGRVLGGGCLRLSGGRRFAGSRTISSSRASPGHRGTRPRTTRTRGRRRTRRGRARRSRRRRWVFQCGTHWRLSRSSVVMRPSRSLPYGMDLVGTSPPCHRRGGGGPCAVDIRIPKHQARGSPGEER
mmetsp:Transcript_11277/g.26994  ORF Transcript_11277/g.26994 Transcript_11277/m.26994 type:complete len:227 (-) Transcript_11277:8-688(-)